MSWNIPTERQVFPSRIDAFDQRNFSASVPIFEFFFTSNCGVDVLKDLVVNKPVDLVSGRVGAGAMFAVLFDSDVKPVGEPDVELPGAAGKDVNEEVVLFPLRHGGRIAKYRSRFLRFAAE